MSKWGFELGSPTSKSISRTTTPPSLSLRNATNGIMNLISSSRAKAIPRGYEDTVNTWWKLQISHTVTSDNLLKDNHEVFFPLLPLLLHLLSSENGHPPGFCISGGQDCCKVNYYRAQEAPQSLQAMQNHGARKLIPGSRIGALLMCPYFHL